VPPPWNFRCQTVCDCHRLPFSGSQKMSAFREGAGGGERIREERGPGTRAGGMKGQRTPHGKKVAVATLGLLALLAGTLSMSGVGKGLSLRIEAIDMHPYMASLGEEGRRQLQSDMTARRYAAFSCFLFVSVCVLIPVIVFPCRQRRSPLKFALVGGRGAQVNVRVLFLWQFFSAENCTNIEARNRLACG